MYPPENFPTFYDRIREPLLTLNIHLIEPVFDEIRKEPEEKENPEKLAGDSLQIWLQRIADEKEGFVITPTQTINERVDQLSTEYSSNAKTRKGVSQNDLLLIATAKDHNLTIVTQEAKQRQRPKKKARYKIPLVC